MQTVYIITNVSASDWTMFLAGSDRWTNEASDAAQFRTHSSARCHLLNLQKRAREAKFKTRNEKILARMATYESATVSTDEV